MASTILTSGPEAPQMTEVKTRSIARTSSHPVVTMISLDSPVATMRLIVSLARVNVSSMSNRYLEAALYDGSCHPENVFEDNKASNYC